MIKLKTALWIGGIVGILALVPSGFLFWKLYEAKQQFDQLSGQLDVQHKNLTKSLQRAETKQATREDLEAFAKANDLDLKAIKADLSAFGARLEAVSSTTAKTTTIHHIHEQSDVNTPSDIEVPTCPEDGRPIDIHGYTKRVETKHIRDANGMRIADVSFEAAEEAPWSDTVFSIGYRINSTIGRTRDGRIILHTELLATSEAEPGETFRIEGVESRTLQVPEEVRFNPWDPHILLGIGLGVVAWPSIDLSASMNILATAMTYGDWSFIGLGIGYDAFQNSFIASFTPFTYNIGGPIPILSDLHLGIFLSIDHTMNVSAGLGISTRL